MALVTLAAALLAGCSSPDASTPVPTSAGGDLACDLLPLEGAGLLSGRDDLSVQDGGLADRVPGQCLVKDGDDFVLQVASDDDATTLRQQQSLVEGADDPLSPGSLGGAPGAGAYTDSGGVPKVLWLCTPEHLVQLSTETPLDGRDAREDLVRYATSVMADLCGVGA